MKEFKVKIIGTEYATHDVKSLKFEKPDGFSFLPGQAADVSIDKPDLIKEKRPFTFTALNAWNYLEFTIKIYKEHNGITKKIADLKVGDELIISEPWGTIGYKGEGTFIAGGAGITPFIAILRELKYKNEIGNNKLVFANKTEADIIRKDEFKNILGKNFINILSHEKVERYSYGFITEKFLKSIVEDFNKMVYICGPPPMMNFVEKIFDNLGVNRNLVIKEEF
jgi:ferredoxin-NADP reductase